MRRYFQHRWGRRKEPKTTRSLPFIRAAHYFGSQWPLNFWSSFTESEVPGDFARIKSDGFNTIILVLPTLTFTESSHYLTEFYHRRLQFLLKEAERLGLYTILRINYPHELALGSPLVAPPLPEPIATMMHTDDGIYEEFLSHLKFVKKLVAEYPSIIMQFLTWEDTWEVFDHFPERILEQRTAYSVRVGFDRYVKTKLDNDVRLFFQFHLDQVNPIPTKHDPKFIIYKKFYDEYALERFIRPARQLLPLLGYELRVDSQNIVDVNGEREWIDFSAYPNEDIMKLSYWAPFMGQENKGEIIDAKEALASLKRIEQRVRKDAGQRHFVDQLNFFDNTARFVPTAASIKKTEINQFLTDSLNYLKETTLGYGFWAYRDFRENYIVNGTFENKCFKWTFEGNANVVGDGPYWLSIRENILLKTDVYFARELFTYKEHYGPMHFSFVTSTPYEFQTVAEQIECKVKFGDFESELKFSPSSVKHSCILNIDYSEYRESTQPMEIRFKIPNGQELKVRDFQFYNHMLSTGLYSVDGESSSAMDVIREFNRSFGSA